jgi:hypothetical protein
MIRRCPGLALLALLALASGCSGLANGEPVGGALPSVDLIAGGQLNAAPVPTDAGTPDPGTSDAGTPDPGESAPPVGSLRIQGCKLKGDYRTLTIFQRDASQVCTTFNLYAVSVPDGGRLESEFAYQPDLLLPPGWQVEDMFSYECTPEREPVDGWPATGFRRAAGMVSFAGDDEGTPLRVQLDVTFSEPRTDLARPPDPDIPSMQLQASDLELSSECLGPGGWPTPP